MSQRRCFSFVLSLVACAPAVIGSASKAQDLELRLRYQTETSSGSGRYHRLVRAETWKPRETAIIVCDVWDLHHSWNAVRRVEEFAPRLDKVLAEARRRGVTIIHSPSDCMDAYADHPARLRTVETPRADTLPRDIKSWCSRIPAEEAARYPLDQSDGGDDDDPREHAEWAAKLKSLGRNPNLPWQKQSELLAIDPQRDYVSDRGDEVWNVLTERGISNVILTGVHTNMCVLGRPFGLRQMVRAGKHVVLMRDMTDTMYNPRRWPYVSHYTGTDLIVSHVERFVCPTMTSDQLIGGDPFRFQYDRRPRLAIVMAEDEYETNRTLPDFAAKYLGKHFRVSLVFGSDKQRNHIPAATALDEADLLLVSVRRRVLLPEEMAIFRRTVASGKPVIGIRTASHAFSLRNAEPPAGYVDWPEFDAQVFGGNYHNHHGNQLKSTVAVAAAAADHPILRGVSREPFLQGGSLYQASPLAKQATVLLTGSVTGHPEEPVAWTFQRADGGRSFYTSMGQADDFDNSNFVRLLLNGIHWAAGLPVPTGPDAAADRLSYAKQWSPMRVPSAWEAAPLAALTDYDGVGWYRCAVRLPEQWLDRGGLVLKLRSEDDRLGVWFNGHPLTRGNQTREADRFSFHVSPRWIEPNEANLLVVRVEDRGGPGGLRHTPLLLSEDKTLALSGNWQFRIGDDASWSNMPLPARYGASTDMLFEP